MGGPNQPAALLLEQAIRRHLPSQTERETWLSLYEEALATLWRLLAPLLGHAGTRAIFDRAVHLATRQQPLAGALRVGEHGVEFVDFRASAAEQAPQLAEEALTELAIALAEILSGLIGSGLMQNLVGDVEITLTRWVLQQAPPAAREPTARDPEPKPAERPREDGPERHG